MKQTKYDSKFERDLHKDLLKGFIYHPNESITFDISFKYSPDYAYYVGDFTYLIESKGYIYTSERARVIKEARNHYNKNINGELIFILQDPNAVLKWQKARKDGSKMTICEWCDKNNFRWFSKENGFLLIMEILNRVKDENKIK